MSEATADRAAIEAALSAYQAQALQTMAAAQGVDRSRFPRKPDLVGELGRRLVVGDGIATLVAGLAPPQVAVLRYLRDQAAATSLGPIKTLVGRLTPSSAEADRQVLGLLTTGLILFDGVGQSWKLDLTGDDPMMASRLVWAPPSVLAATPPWPAWPSVVAEAPLPSRVLTGTPGELLRDIYVLLRSAGARPVRLTRQNALHQSDLKRLVQEMRPHMVADTWRAAGGELTFVLGLTIGAALLEVTEAGLTPSPAATDFLAAGRGEQVAELLRAWEELEWSELARVPTLQIDGYAAPFGDVPGLPQLELARLTIVDAVQALAEAGWWSVASLADEIRQRDPTFIIGGQTGQPMFAGWGYWPAREPATSRHYRGIRRANVTDYRASQLEKETDWDLVEGAFIRQVLLEPLRWLGLVDVGIDEVGMVIAARVTDLGRQVSTGVQAPVVAGRGPRLVVQPNFDIVVLDVGASLGLLARLDEFATPRTIDRAAVYHLNRESVVAALQRGRSLGDIEQLLERESAAPLPQNVQYSLTEWARQFERVTVCRGVCLLEADTSADLDRWLKDARLGPLLGARLGPTVVIVKAGADEEVARRIRTQAGWRNESALPPAAGALRAGPDMTLLLQRDVGGRWERHRLSSLAEPDERGLTYRVTAASLERARSQGWTAPQALGYLQRRLGSPAPARLALLVRGWLGGLGTARQATVRLIELPDAALWGVIEAARGQGLVARATPTLVVVDEPGLAAVSTILAGYGVSVQAAVPDSVVAALQTDQAKGLLAEDDLQKLRGKALRTFLDAAIVTGKRIVVLHQAASQKSPRRLRLTPRFIDHRLAGYYLVATTENGTERSFKLDDIFGVAEEDVT